MGRGLSLIRGVVYTKRKKLLLLLLTLLVYVIAWFAVVFWINSTNNAEIIVRGAAEYNLLQYKCY